MGEAKEKACKMPLPQKTEVANYVSMAFLADIQNAWTSTKHAKHEF